MILRARFHRSILLVERLNFSMILLLVLVTSLMSSPSPSWAQVTAPKTNGQGGRVTLDFNEVDLPVVIRFISELTGKNIVVDETAKKNSGKITIFSPTKVTVDQAALRSAAAEAAPALLDRAGVRPPSRWPVV